MTSVGVTLTIISDDDTSHAAVSSRVSAQWAYDRSSRPLSELELKERCCYVNRWTTGCLTSSWWKHDATINLIRYFNSSLTVNNNNVREEFF